MRHLQVISYIFSLMLLPYLSAYAQDISAVGVGGHSYTFTAGYDTYTIDQTSGTTFDNNLFHTFKTFNIPNPNNTVRFTGKSNIANIINRVTQKASNINGTIKSDIAGANVFLINPYGITFGAGAKLDVSGAFYASSADKIIFADGTTLDSLDTSNVNLTSVPISAFGFLDDETANGAINITDATLANPNNTIGIIGGDVTVSGSASIDAKKIGLAAIQKGGEVNIISADDSTSFAVNNVQEFGDITVNKTVASHDSSLSSKYGDNSRILIRGGKVIIQRPKALGVQIGIGATKAPTPIDSADYSYASLRKEQDNELAIQNGKLDIEAESLTIKNATIASIVGSNQQGAELNIQSDSIILDRGAIIARAEGDNAISSDIILDTNNGVINLKGLSYIASTADQQNSQSGQIVLSSDIVSLASSSIINDIYNSTGASKGINITANMLYMNSSMITARTHGRGPLSPGAIGGDITININGNISMQNNSKMAVTSTSDDIAGTIDIKAKDLFMDRSRFFAQSKGRAQGSSGSIKVDVENLYLQRESRFVASTRSDLPVVGSVYVKADYLSLVDGGQIYTESLNTSTDGADLVVEAGEIYIDGPVSWLSSRTFNGTGAGGNISVTSDSIHLVNGGRIIGESIGRGDAGNITVTTDILNIDTGLISSKAHRGGDAGTIDISANRVTLTNGGEINAITQLTGAGGNIFLTGIAGTDSYLSLENNSLITVESKQVQGGTIGIKGFNTIYMDNSDITATSNAGSAGDIAIAANKQIFLTGGSSVQTEVVKGNGDGGDIDIRVEELLYLRDSEISTKVPTNAGTGDGGNIFIDPIFVVLNNSIINTTAYEGNGGDITIITEYLFSDPFSIIDASSSLGVSGDVVITSLDSEIENSVVELSSELYDDSQWNKQSCSAKAASGKISSLVHKNYAGVPVSHHDWLAQSVLYQPQQFASLMNDTMQDPVSPVKLAEIRLARGLKCLSQQKLLFS